MIVARSIAGPSIITRCKRLTALPSQRHLRQPLVNAACLSTTVSRRGPKNGKSGKKTSVKFAELPPHGVGPDGEPLPPLQSFVPETRGPRKNKAVLAQQAEQPQASDEEAFDEAEAVSDAKPKKTRKTRTTKAKTDSDDIDPDKSSAPTFDDDPTPLADPTSDDSPRAQQLGPGGKPWPALAKEVLNNMARFPGCILLTRVGGFYEAYFEQAPLLAGMLSIKLANRVWSGRPVPMAGFPLSQLEKYLKVLVEDNRKLVAICEEFRPDEQGQEMASPQDWKTINTHRVLNEKVIISRRVTRVVSPGTLIDEKWMNPLRNNFILSISSTPDPAQGFGLAWLDLSTSDFHVSPSTDFESLKDQVKRIAPVEIVIEHDTFTPQRKHTLPSSDLQAGEDYLWQSLDADRAVLSYVQINPASLQRSDLPKAPTTSSDSYSPVEMQAVQALTTHLRSRLLDLNKDDKNKDVALVDLLNPGLAQHHVPADSMAIDSNTLDALEVRETAREGSARGSLVSTVRRTLTKGGSRLLVEWLTTPSTSLQVIERRHAIVEFFTLNPFVHEDLRMLFRQIQRGDVSRTLQRVATARNDEQDLLEIRDFIRFTTSLKAAIYNEEMHAAAQQDDRLSLGLTHLRGLADGLGDLSDLGQTLEEAIDERVMEKRLRAIEALDREDGLLDDAESDDDGSAPSSATVSAGPGRKSLDEEPWGPPFEHLIRPG